MNHIERRMYTNQQYEEIGALVPWTILLDIHNAVLYGFSQNRLAEPGQAVDIAEAEAHIDNIETEWKAEADKRDLDNNWTGTPPLSKMPLDAKLYLHSVLEEAWHNSPHYRRAYV